MIQLGIKDIFNISLKNEKFIILAIIKIVFGIWSQKETSFFLHPHIPMYAQTQTSAHTCNNHLHTIAISIM